MRKFLTTLAFLLPHSPLRASCQSIQDHKTSKGSAKQICQSVYEGILQKPCSANRLLAWDSRHLCEALKLANKPDPASCEELLIENMHITFTHRPGEIQWEIKAPASNYRHCIALKEAISRERETYSGNLEKSPLLDSIENHEFNEDEHKDRRYTVKELAPLYQNVNPCTDNNPFMNAIRIGVFIANGEKASQRGRKEQTLAVKSVGDKFLEEQVRVIRILNKFKFEDDVFNFFLEHSTKHSFKDLPATHFTKLRTYFKKPYDFTDLNELYLAANQNLSLVEKVMVKGTSEAKNWLKTAPSPAEVLSFLGEYKNFYYITYDLGQYMRRNLTRFESVDTAIRLLSHMRIESLREQSHEYNPEREWLTQAYIQSQASQISIEELKKLLKDLFRDALDSDVKRRLTQKYVESRVSSSEDIKDQDLEELLKLTKTPGTIIQNRALSLVEKRPIQEAYDRYQKLLAFVVVSVALSADQKLKIFEQLNGRFTDFFEVLKSQQPGS